MPRAPAETIEKMPEMAVPIASSGTRLWRSAHQPIPITANVRKNPIIERRLRIELMLMWRSWMICGPA
jgi:hypothetical protein